MSKDKQSYLEKWAITRPLKIIFYTDKQTLMEIEFMLKKLSVILTALCLSACSQNVELSKPAPQKMKVQTVDKKSQKGSATVYLCKGNKEVSVVHTKRKDKVRSK